MENFMPGASYHERLEALRTHAERIEKRDYQVPLSDEEIDARRAQFATNSIFVEGEKEKNKLANDAHKELIKPKVLENGVLLREILTKQAKKHGEVYEIPDYEHGMMNSYDEHGEFIDSRRLRPDEKRQMNVFSQRGGSRMFMQTGTND